MEKEIITTERAPVPIGPYSQAVKVGDLYFISGQIGLDPTTRKLVSQDIAQETDQVMKNLWAVLDAGGFTFTDVVKCTIFVVNMDDFDIINAIYGKYFEDEPPTRETVGVNALPKGANVEISCVAVRS